MLNSAVRHAALIAILALAASCSEGRLPTSPTAALPTPPVPDPPVQVGPFAGAGTYEFVPSPGRSVHPYTLESRYVLHDDGTFTLEYLHMPALSGRYRQAGGIVTFDFDWNNELAGAKGVFSGDVMTVSYNENMAMSDFESGAYVKRP